MVHFMNGYGTASQKIETFGVREKKRQEDKENWKPFNPKDGWNWEIAALRSPC
jgi:hypothetical protein